jgi:hypothetical protein
LWRFTTQLDVLCSFIKNKTWPSNNGKTEELISPDVGNKSIEGDWEWIDQNL